MVESPKKQTIPFKGFTIVELIVSMGLFIVVVFMSISLLLALSSINKEAMGIRNAMTEINTLLEDISREMRWGTDIVACLRGTILGTCPTLPVSSTDLDNYLKSHSGLTLQGNTLMFVSGSGNVIVYTVDYSGGPGNAVVVKSTDGGATFSKFPNDAYYLNGLIFTQKGDKYDGTTLQPSISIQVSAYYYGYDPLDPYWPSVQLQTRITQRKPK